MLGSCSVDSSHCRRPDPPTSWHSREVIRHVQSHDYRGRVNWCRHIAYSLAELSGARLHRQTHRPSAMARPPPSHPKTVTKRAALENRNKVVIIEWAWLVWQH